VIREARQTDLDALTNLENHSFTGDRLTRRNLRHLIGKGNATLLVDEEAGKVRGYALVLYKERSQGARLYSIVVGREFRGLGLGRELLKAAEKDALQNGCSTMRLEVRKDNPTAVGLYRRHGYAELGSIPDYYEDHMEALRFEKGLSPRPAVDPDS
jgi:ribosomal-protein-alanine acetyltransferase